LIFKNNKSGFIKCVFEKYVLETFKKKESFPEMMGCRKKHARNNSPTFFPMMSPIPHPMAQLILQANLTNLKKNFSLSERNFFKECKSIIFYYHSEKYCY